MAAKGTWKKAIVEQMGKVGTYNAAFSPVIDTLADILEKRDKAAKAFKDSGGQSCIEYTSDRGSVNVKKNPQLQIWMDLNAQALAYWRDLGLTPAGLKKLNEAALKPTVKKSPLEEALGSFGGGSA